MPKKQRIQLDLSEAQQKTLQELRDQADMASYSEVFRRALAVYQRVFEAEKKGQKFGFINEEMEFVEIVFI